MWTPPTATAGAFSFIGGAAQALDNLALKRAIGELNDPNTRTKTALTVHIPYLRNKVLSTQMPWFFGRQKAVQNRDEQLRRLQECELYWRNQEWLQEGERNQMLPKLEDLPLTRPKGYGEKK